MKRIQITLRQRIFFSMIFLILVSFALTGTISFYHFKNENEQYHQERLRRKEYTVNEGIDYFLSDQEVDGKTDSLVSLFDTKICELADINSMDINIYGLSGRLLISSNPELSDKGIIETQLSNSLLNAINESPDQLLVKTHNDSLQMDYLSTYNLIRNNRHQPIGIVNLPYFDTEDIHKEDLLDFLVTLGQIYFLLFLASSLIAYFLSNFITGSLLAIGNELQRLRLGGDNKRLNWKYEDEIGTVVDEYNRMLEELERSANLLAQQERESAWKEMAKQVAHEIKNPLTPMRLNVQYLARSLKTEDPEKLREFTESMVTQIDALSNIAEAFSRFANMPEPKEEQVSLLELCQTAVDLHPEVDIRFTTALKSAPIQADKDILLRILNNLITNALQAVPEEVEPNIRLELKEREGGFLISVSDNGTGISPELQEKIFEPRFTTKTKGMGLGLAMVKKSLEALGGQIWLQSELGKGTSFYIFLNQKNKNT